MIKGTWQILQWCPDLVTREWLNIGVGFKNQDGEYDVDFIPVVLWDGIAEAVANNCKKGSVVGVKGRIQIRQIEVKEIKLNVLEVVGERVSFINIKRPDALESV